MNLAAGACLFLLTGIALRAADPAPDLVSVCELLKNPAAYEGKPILVIGRYSYRGNGRFLGEEGCREASAGAEKPAPAVLGLSEDEKSAPKVPPILQMDAKAVEAKLERVKRTTPLGRFRFGSSDYDRWAVVYCRLQPPPKPSTVAPASEKAGGTDRPPARLLIRGDGAIVFFGDE